MNSLKRFILRYFKFPLLVLSRSYWFIFRPKTFGAKVILINNNEVLLVKNTYGYKLSLPGGGIKKGESPQDGAKREIFEELGIRMNMLKPLGSIVSTLEFKKDTIYVFYADLKDRNVVIDAVEIESAEWMPLDKTDSKKVGLVTQQMLNLYKIGLQK